MKFAVLGGGITGLSAANRLLELQPAAEIDLFEAGGHCGGVLHTESVDGFLVEHSADMFTTREPAAHELCKRIGLEDELIGTNRQFQRAFIVQGRDLVPVPRGLNLMSPSDLQAIQETPLLTEAGKQRFLAEVDVPPYSDSPLNVRDQSLKEFAVRRFGTEAYERIFQPLVGGIYTADPTKLSLEATLGDYLKMEQKHGSIIRAVQARQESAGADKQTGGARYHLFVAPKKGMQRLIDQLTARLSEASVRRRTRVDSIARSDASWRVVSTHLSDSPREQLYDGLVVALPAQPTAALLQPVAPETAQQLSEIPHASSAIVVHGFHRQQISHPLDGFGAVVPLAEGRNVLAFSFASIKFDGRTPSDHVLIRSFVGGACQPHLLHQNDEQICQLVRADLNEWLGTDGNPGLEKVIRWNRSMPQYHLGHLKRVEQIEAGAEAIPKLTLAGKAYRGVGIPACVASGEKAAEDLLAKM